VLLTSQPLGQLRIPLFQRLDDLQMVDDGAGCPVALRNRRTAHGANVQQQIAGCVDDGLGAAERITSV